MTAPALQAEPGIPIVICGSTLLETHKTLQLDFSEPVCFSSDLQHAMQAAAGLAPAVLLAEEAEFESLDTGTLRVRLALAHSVRMLISISRKSEDRLQEFLRCGVAGFIDRNASVNTIRRAVRCVAAGEIWAPRMLVSMTLRSMVSVIDDPRFTRREIEILRRLAAGEDNRQIAESLFISRETVRWHLRSAYAKLGVHNRNAAASLVRLV